MNNMHLDIWPLCTRITIVEYKGDTLYSVHLINPSHSNQYPNGVPIQDFRSGMVHNSFKFDVPHFDSFDPLGWIFNINHILT